LRPRRNCGFVCLRIFTVGGIGILKGKYFFKTARRFFVRKNLCYNFSMLNLEKEKKLFAKGNFMVGGVDEAGRGSLAGPVVAACVSCSAKFKIDSKNHQLKNINDSKKISKKVREPLYEFIMAEKGFNVGIGIVGNRLIDKINIGQATLLAMKKAIRNIKTKLDFLLIDGNQLLPQLKIKQKAIIRGDEKIFLIAAASIIAKVTRDRMMVGYHHRYERFNFNKHKGYGTSEHRQLINIYGPCSLHRKSFAPMRISK